MKIRLSWVKKVRNLQKNIAEWKLPKSMENYMMDWFSFL